MVKSILTLKKYVCDNMELVDLNVLYTNINAEDGCKTRKDPQKIVTYWVTLSHFCFFIICGHIVLENVTRL
jgi:hypothetical protein